MFREKFGRFTLTMTNAKDVRTERDVGLVLQLLEAVFEVASEAIVVHFHC